MYYYKILFYLVLFVFTNFVYAQVEKPLELQVEKTLEIQQLESQYSHNHDIDILTEKVNMLNLQQEKLKLEHAKELLKLKQEKERLLLENELYSARENNLLAEQVAAKKRLSLENDISNKKHQKAQIALEQKLDNLAIRNNIAEEQNKQKQLEFEAQLSALNFRRLKLNQQIVERKKQQEWNSQVNNPRNYLKEPFVNGKLTISDRKISLDGPIVFGTSDYIVERIHYFNNKNQEYPIFLVIGYCRGGSVMEGVKILKAMENSLAPVYVVVKSFAASMAAVISTLAERSYAYPDAIILHHQVWSYSSGNKTEQTENLKVLEEWSNRILSPIADKMEITLTELIEKMYKNSSSGDWMEFADNAVKYRWIDHIVEDIQDTSFIQKPKNTANQEETTLAYSNVDKQAKQFSMLPKPKPFDVYHLYNPDNYYQY
ncbi:ATP-dependent Clp protease proteolytic subunit [Candidatus Halobeggiatoa sp. HSG11]|nr:ATP-dependent Clp protease proteolytic subunit [Candidatus Halobeggiatoa sp. HSG11]